MEYQVGDGPSEDSVTSLTQYHRHHAFIPQHTEDLVGATSATLSQSAKASKCTKKFWVSISVTAAPRKVRKIGQYTGLSLASNLTDVICQQVVLLLTSKMCIPSQHMPAPCPPLTSAPPPRAALAELTHAVQAPGRTPTHSLRDWILAVLQKRKQPDQSNSQSGISNYDI